MLAISVVVCVVVSAILHLLPLADMLALEADIDTNMRDMRAEYKNV
jgi:hypothetical protein